MEAIEISDTCIAVMCDIARVADFDLDAKKQAVMERLIAQGPVVQIVRSGLERKSTQ